MNVEERFWSHVDFDGPVPEHRPDLGPCWLWSRADPSNGYGRFRLSNPRRMVLAHRVAFALWHGYWPPETADHLCRVRLCVNPLHAEPVSIGVNVLRGAGITAENARKTHCPAGHPYVGAHLMVIRTTGERQCRTCHNDKRRARRAAQRRAA